MYAFAQDGGSGDARAPFFQMFKPCSSFADILFSVNPAPGGGKGHDCMDPKRNGNGHGDFRSAARAVFRKAGMKIAFLARKAYRYASSLPAPVRLAGITAVCFLLIAAILLPAAIPSHPEAFIFAYGEVESDLTERTGSDAPAAPTQAPENDQPESTPEPAGADGGTTEGTGIDPASVEFQTVRDGDRADIVLVIQQRLMELGYMDSDEPTSYFGSLTKHALKTFQRHNGLGDDGVCGEETYALLMSGDAKK